jgi:hypothetical protein
MNIIRKLEIRKVLDKVLNIKGSYSSRKISSVESNKYKHFDAFCKCKKRNKLAMNAMDERIGDKK